MTPGELEQAARRRVATIDPDADARRCARARADRQLSIRDRVDGTAILWARLKAEESVTIWDSLDGHARGRRDDGDPRSLSTLMCDTLVERIAGIRIEPVPAPNSEAADAPHGQSPKRVHTPGPDPDPYDTDAPDPYQDHTTPDPATRTSQAPTGTSTGSGLKASVELQVVLAASTLLGLDRAPGMLRGYGTIPAALARHLADQADSPVLRRLVCDPIDGRLLTMDSRTRCYQGTSRQFMYWRDQHCRLSGADIKQIDHILPFTEDGPTNIPNGQGLAKNPHVIRDHPDIHEHHPTTPHPARTRPTHLAAGADTRHPLEDAHRSHLPTTTTTRPRPRQPTHPPPPTRTPSTR